MNPLYIVRLDDACPTNNLERWNYLESFLDKFKIKPIVCVIPENNDNVLLSRGNFDDNFWDRVHRWVNKGWKIALHGCTHEYISKNKGLVPLNAYSEFAGVPISVQREKIKRGYNILLENGVKPELWVAPAHTFDKNTLKVLFEETDIRIISDGLSILPFNRYGFFWIPQQLWEFKEKSHGVWTICLHPEIFETKWIDDQFAVIEKNIDYFKFDISTLIEKYSKRQKSVEDFLFQKRFFLRRRYDNLNVKYHWFRLFSKFIIRIFMNKH